MSLILRDDILIFDGHLGPLALQELADSTRAAAEAFIAAGTAANTVRSYQSALTYWSSWLRLRYRRTLGDHPLPPEVAVQFIVDHLARPETDGGWSHLLPADLDAALVAAGVKGKLGPWRSVLSAIASLSWPSGIV